MIELHLLRLGKAFYLNPHCIERFYTDEEQGGTVIILIHDASELAVQEQPVQILQAIREARSTGVLA